MEEKREERHHFSSAFGEGVYKIGKIGAKRRDEKLKYAASIIPDIRLFEYELSFKIRGVNIDD